MLDIFIWTFCTQELVCTIFFPHKVLICAYRLLSCERRQWLCDQDNHFCTQALYLEFTKWESCVTEIILCAHKIWILYEQIIILCPQVIIFYLGGTVVHHGAHSCNLTTLVFRAYLDWRHEHQCRHFYILYFLDDYKVLIKTLGEKKNLWDK